jgi:glycosyltransferase involved in cell wall biosynthesis
LDSFQTSIIIPTYNRASYLRECLQALDLLTVDSSQFEILVVDNNSTDNTAETVLTFSESHPGLNIRYICETKQGVSYARNRGVMESCGEIVCFLDDDSPPFANWLKEILKGFLDPTVGCVGGPSILDFRDLERPKWLHGDLQGLLSGYSLPFDQPTVVTLWEHYPLSCNLAVRRKLFASVGLFRLDLDRSGNQVLAAGDTELVDRVSKAGWKVVYLPDAQVNHIVTPERLKKSHIYRIGYGLASSHIILTSERGFFKVMRWFASDFWYATRMFFKFIYSWIMRDRFWFDDYMRFWMVAMRLPIRVKSLLRGWNVVNLGWIRKAGIF